MQAEPSEHPLLFLPRQRRSSTQCRPSAQHMYLVQCTADDHPAQLSWPRNLCCWSWFLNPCAVGAINGRLGNLLHVRIANSRLMLHPLAQRMTRNCTITPRSCACNCALCRGVPELSWRSPPCRHTTHATGGGVVRASYYCSQLLLTTPRLKEKEREAATLREPLKQATAAAAKPHAAAQIPPRIRHSCRAWPCAPGVSTRVPLTPVGAASLLLSM